MERPVNCGSIPEVQERALIMFRLTEDPSSVGFILNDGRMLALDSDYEHGYYTERLFPRVSDHVSAFLETGGQ